MSTKTLFEKSSARIMILEDRYNFFLSLHGRLHPITLFQSCLMSHKRHVVTFKKMYMSTKEPSKFLRMCIGVHRNPNAQYREILGIL